MLNMLAVHLMILFLVPSFRNRQEISAGESPAAADGGRMWVQPLVFLRWPQTGLRFGVWTVSADEQHFWSAVWTLADVDLYHVLLTRQEGYRVVSSLRICLLRFAPPTRWPCLREPGDVQPRPPVQDGGEGGGGLLLDPVGRTHAEDLLPDLRRSARAGKYLARRLRLQIGPQTPHAGQVPAAMRSISLPPALGNGGEPVLCLGVWFLVFLPSPDKNSFLWPAAGTSIRDAC